MLKNNKCIISFYRYRINAFKALTSWIQIGAVTLENIDKNEVMHEAFVTLQNIQGIQHISVFLKSKKIAKFEEARKSKINV